MIVHLSTINLACVVPQGSAILYSMYTAPIADVIKRPGMGFHLYADDTQLHMSFNPVDALKSKSLIKRCIQDVQQWMVVNTLELNGDKTELLILTFSSPEAAIHLASAMDRDLWPAPIRSCH